MPQSDNIYYYVIYAVIIVIFIVVLKMPKKKNSNKDREKPISTSKKFNKNIEKEKE